MTSNGGRGARIAAAMGLGALMGITVSATAGAQTVTVNGAPVRAGSGVSFSVEVPAEWQVDRISYDPLGFGLNTFVRDLFLSHGTCPSGQRCFYEDYNTVDERTTPGEHTVTFTASGGGRTRTFTARFRVDPFVDDDHDGMPDTWERREGLEPFDRLATSAPGDDPDGDGVANIDEFRAGTAPKGRYHQTFGSSSPGERQRMRPFISGIQPDSKWGTVRVRFVGDDGRQAIANDYYSEGPEIFSAWFGVSSERVLAIEVDSYEPLAVERLLLSDTTGLLSTARPAAASADWHFATGPTSQPVDSFLIAFNPGTTPVSASFTYYRAADEAPAVSERVLAPGRTTIWLNADESALAGRDFAVAIHAGAPILMDRGFRRQPPGRTAPQEQTGPGANALAGTWYFPRVQASRDASEHLVLANPGGAACGVEIAVFGQSREPRVSYVTVEPRSRLSVRARDVGVDGLSGVRLTTVTGVPFVAELLQESAQGRWLWSGPGVNQPGRTWGMSLEASGAITIFNPSDEDAVVEARAWYHPTYGTYYTTATLRVPARRTGLIYANVPGNSGDPGPFVGGNTVAVRSLPRADGRPGPEIVVGRGSPAGADGVRDVRVDTVIGTRIQ